MLALVGVPLVLLLVLFIWLNVMFSRIGRVDVSDAFMSGSGDNYLVVGADSDDSDPSRPAGERADTIMVLHFGSDGARTLPIPRDLLVPNPATGEQGRINGVYGSSPEDLVRVVTEELGIPINRYMEVDFASFGDLVDSLGGVTIDFEHPASDPASGLWVEGRGPQRLDGEQALAYVRSRQYTEHISPGETRIDPTADLGRVQRQQNFLSAVFNEMDTRNPFTLMSTFSSISGGLRIDDKMSLMDALRLAWRLRGLDMSAENMLMLEVTPQVTAGGASVLILDEAGSEAVLEQVR